MEYNSFLEDVKASHMNNTIEILEKLKHLDWKNLKRNFDWNIVSQVEQKSVENKMTLEYRWGESHI